MDLKEILEKVISEKDGLPGLKIERVVESPCSKPGDNYMSVVSGAEVQGVLQQGEYKDGRRDKIYVTSFSVNNNQCQIY